MHMRPTLFVFLRTSKRDNNILLCDWISSQIYVLFHFLKFHTVNKKIFSQLWRDFGRNFFLESQSVHLKVLLRGGVRPCKSVRFFNGTGFSIYAN